MIEEARLEEVGAGLAPTTAGWFVVNAAEAAWVRNDAFGARCVFESSPRVLAERTGTDPQMFDETGFTLAVLEPGKPSGMYHAESAQENFLVLSGTCLLLIEEEERHLRAWDFVHCPRWTNHIFVGTGDESVRDLHVGRAPGGPDDRVPGLGDGAQARRRRRAGDRPPRGGVRTVRALAARAAGRLAGPALGVT